MTTMFGRAPSAWCSLGEHKRCLGFEIGAAAALAFGVVVEVGIWADACNCPCHQERGNLHEEDFNLLLHALSELQAQAHKPPATREKAQEEKP